MVVEVDNLIGQVRGHIMAFSWKAQQKKAIRKLKQERQVMLKKGRNVDADKLKRRIDRLEK